MIIRGLNKSDTDIESNIRLQNQSWKKKRQTLGFFLSSVHTNRSSIFSVRHALANQMQRM